MNRTKYRQGRALGATIVLQRTALGWTGYRLAQESGISLSLIGRYESGQRQPTLRNAIRIADALGISLDLLAGREAQS